MFHKTQSPKFTAQWWCQIYTQKTAFIRFVVCDYGCVVRLAVVLWCVVAIAEQNQNLRAKAVWRCSAWHSYAKVRVLQEFMKNAQI